jgi:hypothetical protein
MSLDSSHNAGGLRGSTAFSGSIHDGDGTNIMETAQLIQAAASIATAMAASRYGKFGGMEDARIVDIAVIAVKIARAIEVEAIKNV